MTSIRPRYRPAARSGTPPNAFVGAVAPTRVTVGIAAVALLLIGARIVLPQGLTVGTIVAIALLPSWWPALASFRGARVFVAIGTLAVISGLWLTGFSAVDHRVSGVLLTSNSLLIIGIVAAVGVVVWARTVMGDHWVAAWFGLGLLFSIEPESTLFLSNPWKFGFSTGITIVLLALAHRYGSRWVEILVLVALAGASAVTDARSSFAILLLSVVLTAWQLRPKRPSKRTSAVRFVAAMSVIGFVVYNVGQTLLLDGYLGDAARERSVAQIDTSGSLILGGRPEFAATIALMTGRPLGYGSGILPSTSDITVAKTGMAAIGYQPNNGYVEIYMFGDRFELHSVFGDLWASFGIPGLLVAGIIVVLAIRGLSVLIPNNGASAVLIYLAVRGFWNLFFGPLYGSSSLLIPLMGLVLLRVTAPGATPPLTAAATRRR
ncbi:MAG: hypothetical protein H7146_01960 [Burkholderiaceae bacterium]|nr:hypothetical protein [Microbacteriaceae bacterium]